MFTTMFTKNFLLFSLTAIALAEPLPQGAATSIDFGAAATSAYGSFPTSFDTASLNSELASASALESLLSGLPTLPASVESVLATAVPLSLITQSNFACEIATATPAWYKSLPADVKSALSSYESAASSWLTAHSAQLGTYTASLPAAGCTNGAAVETGTRTTTTTSDGQATSTGISSGTGVSTSKATGAAPRATIASVVTFAGAVGALGLMVAL